MELLARRSARLTVIGDGPQRGDLENLAGNLPITFRGFVPDPAEISRTIAASDVALNLGPIETFGLATLESLACGVPVVVSLDGGSREIITDDCGRAVAADPRVVALAIEDLASIPREMRQKAARSRAELFPWSATASSLLAIYEQLSPRRRFAGIGA